MAATRHFANPIRLLLIDEQDTYREALAAALANSNDLLVAGQADRISAAGDMAWTSSPDVAILGTTQPTLQVPDLVRRLGTTAPAAKLLVLSPQAEPEIVSHVLKAGASGYLTTRTGLPELFAAVRKIAAGGRAVSQQLVDSMLFVPDAKGAARCHLTDRELQVLCAFAAGQSIKAIASTVNLSAKTVSTHKSRLMQKLHLKSNADLVRYALECDLI
ncbi:MAG: response regulator transcription factor [Sterolibacteriaceae bacterium MAG5]|nr:response regulator transcription factor [Candidatus Nitricoxidireducens bremensis]